MEFGREVLVGCLERGEEVEVGFDDEATLEEEGRRGVRSDA